MHVWSVRQRYGHGVGSVALAAEPYMLSDFHTSLDARAARDFLLPTLAFATLVCALAIGALSLGRAEPEALEVMLIARDVPEPPMPEVVLEPEPVPPPEIAKRVPEPPQPAPAPPAPPLPMRAPPPAPPLPVQAPVERIAVARKPPPPPTPIAEPRPMPKLAAFSAAPLAEPLREAREARDRPRAEFVRPAIDQPVPVPALAIPAEPEQRSTRFASVRPDSTSQTRPHNTAIGAIAAPALDEAQRPSRSRSARSDTAAPARREPQLALAAPAAPGAAIPAEATASRRSGTVTPEPRPARRGAPPALSAASFSAPAHPSSVASSRAATREVPAGPAAERSANPVLAGVPLASLAACVSDREEDALKRRVVAAVTAQGECRSRAGTFRFVEAKNLNAFLMTIERSSNRALLDRCAELTNALACLAQPARR